jgi:two-component system chemotaxis sensor kinase CheA
MDLDLAQFHDSFFEESFEALDGMEAALLELDVGAPDPEGVNSIFRVAHSIKGGAGMFGFKDVTSFTHTLETLLDEMRSGRLQVTAHISDQLLLSVDVMRAMLRAVQRKEPIDVQKVADLQFDLEMIVASKGSSAPGAAAGGGAAAPVAQAATISVATGAAPAAPAGAAAASAGCWKIGFRALPELLLRGNDPLAIFASLAELGNLAVVANLDGAPKLRSIDAERCYITWKLQLQSDCARDEVDAAFEWAAVDCELTIERVAADSAQPQPQATAVPPPPAAAQQAEAVSTPVAPEKPAAAQSNPTGAAPAQADSPKPAEAPKAAPAEQISIRVGIEKIDELINTVGELVITQAMLSELGRTLDGPVAERFRSGLNQLERNMRELQESVMRVRMLPISFTFSRFPRMVRDLAQRLGKQIELKMTGEQTELDKTVLEKIGDPLMHLVRNSVDHGIESPQARLAAGKPATGIVHLDACHRGGQVAVEIRDDGAGLDKNRILAKARSRGLVGANDVLTDEQVHELIFLPGFSTAEKTTDVSGRGVGMDVVRRNVKELGGNIEIGSEFGKGSRFIITLPLTLAIVDGQSVSVGSETYIVPLTSIVESLQLQPQSVNRLSGHGEVFSFRGDYLPVVRLHDLFGVEPRARALHEGLIVVAEGDGRRIGLFVDELLGQQQVVIKSMEANYGPIDGVAGATILGDGSVALILDLPGLIRVAAKTPAAACRSAASVTTYSEDLATHGN